ncbi:rpoE leader peptide RseD [Klebsiella pneumoniae]|nr:rpoE leader peptide RseD [Klebsiella pneumoniae]
MIENERSAARCQTKNKERCGTLLKNRHSNSVSLLKVQMLLEWRFEDAWEFGLGRHYLG